MGELKKWATKNKCKQTVIKPCHAQTMLMMQANIVISYLEQGEAVTDGLWSRCMLYVIPKSFLQMRRYRKKRLKKDNPDKYTHILIEVLFCMFIVNAFEVEISGNCTIKNIV